MQFLEPAGDVPQTDAVEVLRTVACSADAIKSGDTDARIGDFDHHALAVATGGHIQTSAAAPSRQPMLDRVLDKRLNRERRHGNVLQDRRQFHFHMQLIPKTHLLDGEVVLHESELFFERHKLTAARIQGIPEDGRQMFERGFGLIWLFADERRDRVQCVIEEMRIYFRAKRAELGFCALAMQRSLALDDTYLLT